MFGEARANLIRSLVRRNRVGHELQESLSAQSKGGSSSNTLGPPRSSERVIVFAVIPAVLLFSLACRFENIRFSAGPWQSVAIGLKHRLCQHDSLTKAL